MKYAYTIAPRWFRPHPTSDADSLLSCLPSRVRASVTPAGRRRGRAPPPDVREIGRTVRNLNTGRPPSAVCSNGKPFQTRHDKFTLWTPRASRSVRQQLGARLPEPVPCSSTCHDPSRRLMAKTLHDPAPSARPFSCGVLATRRHGQHPHSCHSVGTGVGTRRWRST